MRHRGIALTAVVALLGVAGATGCQSAAMDRERMLAAAGFQLKLADTPERMAVVQNLPQQKITMVPKDGEPRFVYADAKYCKCTYVGTEAAYDRYQRLRLHSEIANEEAEAAMNWGVWGGWGPWW